MTEHDDLTGTLTRELAERAGVMDGSTLHLADVQGRARSIRRRRTAAVLAGAAAAVAVIVPTAVLATHSNGRPEPAPATQSPAPSESPSASADHQPAPGVLDVSDLPAGGPPVVDYVRNGVFHAADGSTYDVATRYTPVEFVELADGSVVWHTVDDNGAGHVEIRDPDGVYHEPVRTTSQLSVNAAHSIVAWLTPSGQVMIWEGWASQPRALGDPVPGDDVRIGPVTGSGEAAPGQPGPDCRQSSCTVVVNVHDGPNQPWVVDDSGSQPLRDGGFLDVNDVSRDGLTVGLTRITDFKTCSRLLGGGEFEGFETCANQLTSFSPDGQLVLALPSYFDGVGPGGIAVYDLAGERLFHRNATVDAQSYFLGQTWEDDSHVLAATYQDGRWAVVRFAVDGSMEYAVPPVKGPYETSPFILPTGGGLPAA